MAVNLLGASNARVEWGGTTVYGGATALTVAFTIRVGGSLTGQTIFGQWGDDGIFEQVFLAQLVANELNVYMCGGAFQQYAFGTNDTPLTTNTLHRVVCRVQRSPKLIEVWVNGALRSTVDIYTGGAGGATPPVLSAGNQRPTFAGHLNDMGIDGVDGDYSELAVWTSYVPDWVVEGYCVGMSPKYYGTGLVFYAPLHDTSASGLVDHVHAHNVSLYTGTNTSGTDAAHPFVFYPNGVYIGDGPAASTVEVEPEIGQSFGPLVWVEWGGSDDAMRIWAPVDLPDPLTYYHGYKTPWLLSAGKVVRALSDEQGEYQGQTFDVTVNDTSRDIRTLLGTSDDRRHLLNTRGVMRMISQDDWRAKLVPRTVAIGKVRNYRLH